MKGLRKQLLSILIGCILLTACKKDDDTKEVSASRTIIIYMAADNDLSSDARADLEEIKQGLTEAEVNLIVFLDPSDESPCILRMLPDVAAKIRTYCGLSSYIPHSGRYDLNDYYRQPGWYAAGGYNKLF